MQEGINEEWAKHGTMLTKHLQLANGDSISIQCGYHAYCLPRINQPYSLYTDFELLYSGKLPVSLEPYHDDVVCAFVPMHIIETVIFNAGGIVGHKLQKVAVD